jgi:hypothetical protein
LNIGSEMGVQVLFSSLPSSFTVGETEAWKAGGASPGLSTWLFLLYTRWAPALATHSGLHLRGHWPSERPAWKGVLSATGHFPLPIMVFPFSLWNHPCRQKFPEASQSDEMFVERTYPARGWDTKHHRFSQRPAGSHETQPSRAGFSWSVSRRRCACPILRPLRGYFSVSTDHVLGSMEELGVQPVSSDKNTGFPVKLQFQINSK